MEEQKRQAVKEFIESIIPDIKMIDGGCYPCITDFCDNVNDTLEAYSLKLESTDERPVKVTLKDI